MSEIKNIVKWFETAKPEPTIEDVCVQIGCHYEEVSEMAELLYDECAQEALGEASFDYKTNQSDNISFMLESLDDIPIRIATLDAICDQIVTAIGVAKFLGMDIEGALAEVNASNWSKFVDGKAVFDENGKIAKPDTYFKPNLEPFVGELPWEK